MQKILFTIFLAATSSSTMAEWVKVGGHKSVTYYADSATISKKSNFTKMFYLMDYMTVQDSAGIKYLSSKIHIGYDCKKMKFGSLGIAWYAENMGGGEQVYSRTLPGEWRRPQHHSIDETLMEFACNKEQ